MNRSFLASELRKIKMQVSRAARLWRDFSKIHMGGIHHPTSRKKRYKRKIGIMLLSLLLTVKALLYCVRCGGNNFCHPGCYNELKPASTYCHSYTKSCQCQQCTRLYRRITYILLAFSDRCSSRVGVLLPPYKSTGGKNCRRTADIHHLQHIQSATASVKKQKRQVDFPTNETFCSSRYYVTEYVTVQPVGVWS